MRGPPAVVLRLRAVRRRRTGHHSLRPAAHCLVARLKGRVPTAASRCHSRLPGTACAGTTLIVSTTSAHEHQPMPGSCIRDRETHSRGLRSCSIGFTLSPWALRALYTPGRIRQTRNTVNALLRLSNLYACRGFKGPAGKFVTISFTHSGQLDELSSTSSDLNERANLTIYPKSQ